MKIKTRFPKLYRSFCLVRGRLRLCLGFCPMCNSDAPELYACPICAYYSSASGDKFPPDKSTKAQWWQDYKKALNTSLRIRQFIAKKASERA